MLARYRLLSTPAAAMSPLAIAAATPASPLCIVFEKINAIRGIDPTMLAIK